MVDSVTAPFKAICDLVESFQAFNIKYLIGGSIASSLFGRFRTTNDIDCLYQVADYQVAALVEYLEQKFIVDSDTLSACIKNKKTFNIIHEDTFVKVDLFVAQNEFHTSELLRAIEIKPEFAPCGFFVATAEDILLAKLKWLQDTGLSSERQIHDIEGIVAIKGQDLEVQYLSKWAKSLGVSDLLNLYLSSPG